MSRAYFKAFTNSANIATIAEQLDARALTAAALPFVDLVSVRNTLPQLLCLAIILTHPHLCAALY
jgi:hypothetical protein